MPMDEADYISVNSKIIHLSAKLDACLAISDLMLQELQLSHYQGVEVAEWASRIYEESLDEILDRVGGRDASVASKLRNAVASLREQDRRFPPNRNGRP